MEKILAYLKGIMGDSDGSPSSKRFISVGCVFLVAIAFCGSLFYGLKVEDNVLNTVMAIAIAGLGMTGAEKFASKISDKVGKNKE